MINIQWTKFFRKSIVTFISEELPLPLSRFGYTCSPSNDFKTRPLLDELEKSYTNGGLYKLGLFDALNFEN